ncbi:hypothetical protein B1J92_I07837g [Nakaseomyces glabratus]|nr:hypothetical protein B1J91_I07837g [Nakaseomyces glabratus]OXB47830.1 hypothetical protein B1J92_I07837g [Nakaseomyces glabratus]
MAGGYKLQRYKGTKVQSYKGTSEAMDESQLKGKLWYCVDRLLAREERRFSQKFVSALVELVYVQLVEVGETLESYAQHGGRDVVSMADLRLLLRRSPELLAMCDPEGSQ